MKIANKIKTFIGAIALAATLIFSMTPSLAFAEGYSSSYTFHIVVEATQMEVAIPTNIESIDTNVPFGGLPIFMKSGFPIQLHSITKEMNKTTFNFDWCE